MKRPDDLTIGYVETKLDWPAKDWEGKCFAVASQMVKQGIVKGEAVYGAWTGVPTSRYWAHKAHHPFIRHGWIVLPDGRILDPTRWSFEGVDPYIWIGRKDHEEYDEGNNGFAEMMLPRTPWPESDGAETRRFELLSEIVREVEHHGAELTDEEIDGLDYGHIECHLTVPQVSWLANFPITLYSSLDHAREVFTQIAEHDLKAFIPLDNWNKVMGK